jgi:dipeptidyl aminopeptidase/acylaminoacyl peptidase
MNVSPFTHADKIAAPLLLIHGQTDSNPGTHPLQSERLFEALRGNGATARLVLLPHDGHGYTARESVLHALAEMLDWADRHVRRAGAAEEGSRSTMGGRG